MSTFDCREGTGNSFRDCAVNFNNLTPTLFNLSTIDVTSKIIFERLNLVSGLRWFAPRVNCPYTSTHSPAISRFHFFALHDSPSNLNHPELWPSLQGRSDGEEGKLRRPSSLIAATKSGASGLAERILMMFRLFGSYICQATWVTVSCGCNWMHRRKPTTQIEDPPRLYELVL